MQVPTVAAFSTVPAAQTEAPYVTALPAAAEAASRPPHPQLHMCPLAEPLLAGLGGGEDGHLLPIQLQHARVLVPHHLWDDKSHPQLSHLHSAPSPPACAFCISPACAEGGQCLDRDRPVLLLGIWLVS